MQPISTRGFEYRGGSLSAGECPELRWVSIGDLVAVPREGREPDGRTRLSIKRIADDFNWSCFAPAIVTPTAGGKFAIVDGYRRVTAAAIVGFDAVPCQIVTADSDQLAVACRILNGGTRPNSRMAAHAAGLNYSEPNAMRLRELCERAGVELLRYPVPVERQAAGQTMAIAAIAQCLERYGDATLITALQCVTQTANNQPGLLTSRIIKALCAIFDADHELRDQGLALLEAFDSIDLSAIQANALNASAKGKTRPVDLMIAQIRGELCRLMQQRKAAAPKVPTREVKLPGAHLSASRQSSHLPNRAMRGRNQTELID